MPRIGTGSNARAAEKGVNRSRHARASGQPAARRAEANQWAPGVTGQELTSHPPTHQKKWVSDRLPTWQSLARREVRMNLADKKALPPAPEPRCPLPSSRLSGRLTGL